MKCPKCKGEMVEGQLHTQRGLLSVTEILFIPVGQSKLGLIKKTGNRTVSYCCSKCGYIETFLDK